MRNNYEVGRRVAMIVIVVILIFSIPSILHIPFGKYLGIDLQNLYAYHTSAWKNSPYSAEGELVGDYEGRDMIYPPILYYSFTWLRFVDFPVAAIIWAIFITVGLILSIFIFLETEDQRLPRWKIWGFIILMLVQYPSVFLAERGNNDIVVLLLWAISFFLFRQHEIFLSGFLTGLAAHYKIYPAFALFIVIFGSILGSEKPKGKSRFTSSFISGVGMAFIVGIAVAPGLFFDYFSRVLIDLTTTTSVLSEFSHSLRRLFPRADRIQRISGYVLSLGLGLTLIIVWMRRAMHDLQKDPIAIFAGALAISTYFAGISYDYNLITTYPLLAVLFYRINYVRGFLFWRVWALLVIGLIAIIGHRGVFAISIASMKLHVALQWLWLVLTGIFMPTENSSVTVAESASCCMQKE